jgi:hypothetical protein
MPEVNIQKLSPTQLRKMRKGLPFRITAGADTSIFLNDLQFKGFKRNTKNGKSYTIVYEGVKEGSGILGAVLSGAAGLSDLIGGPGSREASQVLGTIGGISNAIGLGMKKPKKGKGLLGDIAKELAINMAKSAGKFAIDKGADYAKGKIEGLGMLRKASPKQLASLAKARSMIGMKKRTEFSRSKAKKTGAGRSRKKIYGSALYPGGY